jgi:Spy/CpxP family protein refolding chaperone
MDVQSIVSELKAERNRISQAITILEGTSIGRSNGRAHRAVAAAPHRTTSVRKAPSLRKGRSRLTPEGRRKLSQLMKQRWAERRKKAE